MSASPFGAMPAIRSFQDATNELAPSDRDMPQRPAPRPNDLAKAVGVRYNPLHPMINLEDRRRAGGRKRPGRDSGPVAAVMVDAGPLTNWIGDARFLERPYAEVRTPAIHGDTTWHQGTVTGKAEGGVVKLRITGIDQVGITMATGEAQGVLPSRS